RGHWSAVGQRARAGGRGSRVEGMVLAQPGILRHPEVNVLRRYVEHDRDRVGAREDIGRVINSLAEAAAPERGNGHLVSVAGGIRHVRDVRGDVVPADGQNVEVAGGLRVGIGDGNLALRRLWARVSQLQERWFAADPTCWWRAGPKRCRLHQPPGRAQRGWYVVGPW